MREGERGQKGCVRRELERQGLGLGGWSCDTRVSKKY
jgi:hypothetical protein